MCQGIADMGGHVVRPFSGMREQRITVRHQPLHELLKVRSHIRIGILAQYQRGAGVLQENVTKAGVDTRLSHLLLYGISNRIAAAPRSSYLQRMLIDHQLSHGPL